MADRNRPGRIRSGVQDARAGRSRAMGWEEAKILDRVSGYARRLDQGLRPGGAEASPAQAADDTHYTTSVTLTQESCTIHARSDTAIHWGFTPAGCVDPGYARGTHATSRSWSATSVTATTFRIKTAHCGSRGRAEDRRRRHRPLRADRRRAGMWGRSGSGVRVAAHRFPP